jgi:hypothetical protein
MRMERRELRALHSQLARLLRRMGHADASAAAVPLGDFLGKGRGR